VSGLGLAERVHRDDLADPLDPQAVALGRDLDALDRKRPAAPGKRPAAAAWRRLWNRAIISLPRSLDGRLDCSLDTILGTAAFE